MSDIEFMDLNALDEDLSKALASSKTQEELCKLLGINRGNG